MIRFSQQPLRRQLIVASLLLLLPIIASWIWIAVVGYRERVTDLEEYVESTSATMRNYLIRHLESIDSIAAALAQHPSVLALDGAACSRLFLDLRAKYPFLQNISLTARDGYNRGTGLPWPPGESPYAGDRPWFKQVVATGRPALSEYQIGRISGKPTVMMAYPVFARGDQVAGVIGLGLNLETLHTVFASVPLPEGSVVTLADRRSVILARSLEPQRFIGTQIERSPTEPSVVPRSVIRLSADGVERIYSNAVIERGPWVLSVGIPTTVAMARAMAGWQRTMLAAALSFVASFALALFAARAITRPLADLEGAAQRIAAGDLTPPVPAVAPNREVARLRSAFVVMAERLRQAREAIDQQLREERRMREEVQSLQRQTVRQERLAAVGQLVSGVAHELNNPLQVVAGLAEVADRDPQLTEALRHDLQVMRSESLRAGDIIRNLLLFVRQQCGPPGPVELADVVQSVVQLRQHDLERQAIAIATDIRTARPVQAVFSELQQVVLNFVVNAEQALDHVRGQRRIAITAVEAGETVRVEVSDNGPGVSPEHESKLFQPFFTTKPVGQGTGLGLSVSYGIIESHGGTIGYQTNASGGATFFFELPALVHAPVRV